MTAPLYVITGAMAAGKSTVARLLVHRFERSAHVGGDAFRRMIVRGAAAMGPVLDPEALNQLHLRQDIALDTVRRFVGAGFATVYQDILIGADLARVAGALADLDPRIVVLKPDAATLAQRDRDRAKTGYGDRFPPEALADALEHDTPRTGLWIDSSAMDADAVVERILAAW